MDAPVVTVRAKYLVNGPKGQSMQGVLVMSGSRFKWTSNDPKAADKNVDVDFLAVKSHKSSKETPKSKKALLNLCTEGEGNADGGYLFEFQNFQERDTCRDIVANALSKQRPPGSAQSSGQSSGGPSVQPPGSAAAEPVAVSHNDQLDFMEMERRMKLLQEDRELQKLHQQLVISGVLSEAEFWAARKHMLEDEGSRIPKQRTGLKSAMLADVRPLTDGRTNKVTFNLTPEIIHQIFAEKPAVHRAFLMNVPSKMSEIDFWTKYCRAEYLYRTKNAAAAAAEAADDEDLAVFTRADDILASSARRKIQRVDPTLDMAADLADDYLSLPGHGILRDGNKESTELVEGAGKRTIVHDINRHAAVVLEGRPLDAALKDTTTVAHALARAQQADAAEEQTDVQVEKRRMNRVHNMTEIEDLRGDQAPAYVPLCIQDPRKYFDSQQANATGDAASAAASSNPFQLDPSQALQAFQQQLTGFQMAGSGDNVISPDIAVKVLTDLTHHIASSKYTTGVTAERTVLESLPRASRDEFLQHSATVNELLRHFWAAYPLTSVLLVKKANRLKDAMGQLYSRIQMTKEGAQPDVRHQLSRLLQPLFQALDAAFAHHEAEAGKRAARTSQRPLGMNSAINGVTPVTA